MYEARSKRHLLGGCKSRIPCSRSSAARISRSVSSGFPIPIKVSIVDSTREATIVVIVVLANSLLFCCLSTNH